MIRVRFDGAQMTVSGHAGYAPAGAAALALVRCGVEQLAQAYPGCVEITGS